MEIYRVSKWHDKNNYECLFCRYATLSEAAIWQHWQMKHAPPPPPASPILLADASGREISNDPLASLDESDTEVSEDVDLEA